MATTTDKVKYHILICGFCRHIYKWIDERMPTFCPECGRLTYQSTQLEFTDREAELTYKGR